MVRCSKGSNGEDSSKAQALISRVLQQLEREGKVQDPKQLQKLVNKSLQQKKAAANPVSQDEDAERWLELQAFARPWQVPWGVGETVGGMALWVGGFVATGVVLVPLLAFALKLPGFGSGSEDERALFALFNQVLETVVGLSLISAVVRRSQPLPPELFNFDPQGPFRKPDGWASWGLAGISAAPVVILLAGLLLSLFNYEEVGGRGTVDAVAGFIQLSPVSFVSLLTVTSVLAPLLEETVFRGFLLTSLTKFMPTPAAVVVSSVAFGAAHLSARDFPQLFALGLVLGFSYVRSRNLLTPMMIHAMWNGTVLTILFLLTAAGVDIQELLAAR